ncbi:unnamed protein product [Dovyalis caffra]|uniref:Kri1-like C-terminal domain-containing protein n=1 Tax=Dovyalis caffra TaxID=77055 RepID=A0AAV1SX56_9ROSI|nr:unnamed protein product [Dovyalis caffra]
MPLKLFDDDGDANKDDVSKIEIDQAFAKRYEHNKKREALQRYEELQKKGLIDESDSKSESESESSDDEEDETDIKKKDIKFFENLLKVKNRDPSLYSNVKLFDSDNETDSSDKEEEIKDGNEKDKKKKPMYLKDVVAKHLIEEGPEFVEEQSIKKEEKSYNEEQEELRKAFLDAVGDAEEDGEEDEFLKVKERKNEEVSGDGNADDDVEFEKKLGDYFGGEGELDEGSMFLRDFFKNKMWLGKDEKGGLGEDEVDELLRDEEEVERQEKYEESYNFRYEESVGDRVLGHSRKVEGSVRNKDNSRKEQRKNREERMKIAEMERKEELKHLKNLKKKEMKEKMKRVMEVAGFKDDNDFTLDLEDEFDPDEYDKMMKKAFDDKYYDAEEVELGFGSDDGEMEKPDFDKEDELLGFPKDWDMVDSADGFLAARERSLKLKQQNGDDYSEKEEEEEKNGEERSEESKRKRKRKMSLVQKVKEEMLEEYYKLDYEDTIGDLKTRFKYAKVNPNRFGLKTEEILDMDDKELNTYVSIKKLAPYRDNEWKVPNTKKHQQKMMIKERLQGKFNKKNRSKDNKDKSTSALGSKQDRTEKLDESNDTGNLSRKAKRRRRQAELKLSHSRLIAYGKVQP